MIRLLKLIWIAAVDVAVSARHVPRRSQLDEAAVALWQGAAASQSFVLHSDTQPPPPVITHAAGTTAVLLQTLPNS